LGDQHVYTSRLERSTADIDISLPLLPVWQALSIGEPRDGEIGAVYRVFSGFAAITA